MSFGRIVTSPTESESKESYLRTVSLFWSYSSAFISSFSWLRSQFGSQGSFYLSTAAWLIKLTENNSKHMLTLTISSLRKIQGCSQAASSKHIYNNFERILADACIFPTDGPPIHLRWANHYSNFRARLHKPLLGPSLPLPHALQVQHHSQRLLHHLHVRLRPAYSIPCRNSGISHTLLCRED